MTPTSKNCPRCGALHRAGSVHTCSPLDVIKTHAVDSRRCSPAVDILESVTNAVNVSPVGNHTITNEAKIITGGGYRAQEKGACITGAINVTPAPVDEVDHPAHYQTDSGIECIDAIQAALTPEEFAGFCKGNSLKYLWRAGKKGQKAKDLGKASWYLKKIQEIM